MKKLQRRSYISDTITDKKKNIKDIIIENLILFNF